MRKEKEEGRKEVFFVKQRVLTLVYTVSNHSHISCEWSRMGER